MIDQPYPENWPDLIRRAVAWASARNVRFGVLLKRDKPS